MPRAAGLQALEDKQTQLDRQTARVEELESQVARLTKEKDLLQARPLHEPWHLSSLCWGPHVAPMAVLGCVVL